MDPVLRLKLLQRCLEPACEGSAVFAELFSNYRRIVEDADVDLSVNWMDSQDDLAKVARLGAKVVLGDLPNLSETVKDIKKMRARLMNSVVPKYKWIGWLGHGAEDQWRLFRPNGDAISGDLRVLYLVAGEARAKFVPIGKLANGTIHWDTGQTDAFIDGRPVFLREASSTTTATSEHR